MKFGRRAFLQFAAGAVGGTLLSPLPWKLADDSAIWSQNWSWRPSPERGPITKAPTICLFCDSGCGIQAHLVNSNRAILLEGNPANPVNQGGVCPLCAAGAQFLYASYRVTQPMKQTKARGDASGFQPISWEEAVSELSTGLSKMRTADKAHGLACIAGRRRSSMFDLWRQFFNAFGSQNLFEMPSHADSLRLATSLTMGQEATPAFALERASYVLSFGADLIGGWGAAGRMQSLFGHWRQEQPGVARTKIVQIEPRLSLTATKADEWVPIRPGAQAALALGIAAVMIENNLYDADFVSNYVFGFDDWTDSTGKTRQGFKNFIPAAYAPAKVTEQTGVEAEKIEEMAREFASQQNSVAVWGGDGGRSPNNIYSDLAFLALNALKGNLRAGGMISLVPSVPLAPLPEVEADEWAQKGLEQPRLDLTQAKPVPLPGNGLYAFLDTLTREARYSIEMLMIHEANPVYSLPENQVVKNALQKIDRIVTFSSYMDETAMQSDLILPDHIALERYDDVIGLPGVPYAFYAVSKPILPPRLDTKHTGDLILTVAGKMGGAIKASLPWKNYEEYLQSRVQGLASAGTGAIADKQGAEPWNLQPGQAPKKNYKNDKDLWNKLISGLCWYDAPVDPLQNLPTQSAKYELVCTSLQNKGLNVEDDQVYLPHYAPLAPSGDETQLPLLVVSYRALSLSSGYLANPPFMNKTLWSFLLKGNDLLVEVNPETAKSLGLKEGDRATLKTPGGEVEVRIHLFPGAHPGTVFIAEGLGHTAYDEYIRGKGVNANEVIEVQMDPITGLGTVWATRAQLARA